MGDGNGTCDRTTAGSLGLTDLALIKQLASPHSPGLCTLEGGREAVVATGTLCADRLGALHVYVFLGEEQVRQRAVSVTASQWGQDHFVLRIVQCDGHSCSFLVCGWLHVGDRVRGKQKGRWVLPAASRRSPT